MGNGKIESLNIFKGEKIIAYKGEIFFKEYSSITKAQSYLGFRRASIHDIIIKQKVISTPYGDLTLKYGE